MGALEPGTVELLTIAFRALFTVLVAVIVPVYLVKYGPYGSRTSACSASRRRCGSRAGCSVA
jgi:hypothetical protein